DTTIAHWFEPTEGANPMAGPVKGADGHLYGTTQNGGTFGYGTVFRLDEDGIPTTLHDFQSVDGARPASPLGIGPEGSLLGAVPEGGAGLHGAVFRIDGAGLFYTAHEFARAEGLHPASALLQTADGSLWGTTVGNADEGWTVYRFSLTDGLTTIHTFTGPDGSRPIAELIRASNGQLYGTTQDGGSNGLGTVFTIDEQNVLMTLHSFDGADGAIPEAGLVQASDGNLYGTASGGGAQGSGTAFRMTLDGDFLSLHDFEVAVDGQTPKGSLIQASDGDLYGTTETGDVYGTVIRMDTAGNVTKIHAFSVSAEGAFPEDGVMQASDGKLYGTEQTGGIFRIDGTGDFFDFGPPLPGYQLFARPVQALDGDLYGTTAYGGFTDRGTLYRMTLAGLVIPLYEFSPWDTGGMYPSQRLIQAADGNLYGVAGDGAGLSGVLFRWLSTTPSAVIDRIAPTSGHFDGASAAVIGSHFAIQTPVKVGVLPGIAPVTIDQGTITLIMPSLVPGTLNDVTIPDRDGSTVTLTGAWFVDFFDVNSLHIFHDYVETIFRAGITAGYGNGYYGIDDPVSRAQMAVFLLKGEHGGSYTPPPCTGIFVDVECTPAPAFAVDWIEQLSHEEITAGCTDSVHYCPDQPIPRSQMAVFLLKAEHGSGYVPPACKGEFLDVPCPATPDFPYSDWVEQLASEGITAGCGPELFCPDQAVTRGQMAVFLVRTFPLP
ncbi:MAG TPA: choice-of-anchor tandem repeat GloVer-containing protein, partial [Thermoanaerobaculia bacterium]